MKRDDAERPAAFRAAMRSDFLTFAAKCARSLSPGQPVLSNWHLEAIAHALEEARLGLCKRLIINLPPRSLKSTLCSVAFPAFILGHDPTRRIICVSYGAELTTNLANQFRSIVESPWYLDLFREMRLDARKNTEGEVTTTRRGYRLSVSPGGALTGRGGDIVIIDDPLKAVDALSDAKRTGVNLWFLNTLVSRLDDKQTGVIIIVMQRVHMDDLVGFVTQLSPDWKVLSFPAIADIDETIDLGAGQSYFRRAGEALHEAREPLPVLEELRRQVGADNFSAQYQQMPIPPGGAMIKRDWIRRYVKPPPRTYQTKIVQSWDTASKGGAENDFSVCTTWQVESPQYFLLDVHRARYDYPSLKAKVAAMAKQFQAGKILIEDAGTAMALIQELRYSLAIVGVTPVRDKISRMSVQSLKFECGQVYLPEGAPWLAALFQELLSFPNSKHDDQIDSISQALENFTSTTYTLDHIFD